LSTDGNRAGWPPLRTGMTAAAAVLALAAAGCAGSHTAGRSAGTARDSAVRIDLTPQGCAPRPARIPAGPVTFKINNKNAGAVSEAELRTADLAHILGEQENVTPGLSGGFALSLQPGRYTINCPGAGRPHWTLTVAGKAAGGSRSSNAQLTAAVTGYSRYVEQNAAGLVTHTEAFCRAIGDGQMSQARLLYPQARVYYERIEPVAEIWGSLDTDIDGRWENPVTVASRFTGFHKIEQLLWQDNTLAGTPQLCAGLVAHEQQLLQLVRTAQYNPLEMASGATDLINEAATSKISGEEERYSDTDLPVFQANVQGAMEVVALLQPYLRHKDPALVSLIQRRDASVAGRLASYRAVPGYDGTGFVDYSAVPDAQRRQLATSVNALAEAMSGLSVRVSS
jgi:iron uptake system component EfeO